MASIEQRLSGHQLIGLDSAIFIYHLEGHPTYLPLTRRILGAVQSGMCQGVISTVTIMELTVRPWQLGRTDVARQYETLLVNFPNLRLVDVTRDIAGRAARLRAQYNLRPADALQMATALSQQATAWVTNYKGLRRLEAELAVILLDDFVES